MDRDGGTAAIFARFERFADAAAGSNHGEIIDCDVAENAHLPAHHDMMARFGRAGDAGLRSDQIVGADFDIVGNLDEVVDLRSLANDRRIETGTIDGCIGANLDIVFDNDNADLLEFMMASICIGRIAKSARTDDRAALNNHAIAQSAAFADGAGWIECAVGSDFHLSPMKQ